MSRIKVNDELREVTLPITLTELIQQDNIVPDMVSVQINGTLLERAKYDDTAVSEGDEIDFLFFMGGGSL
ncbi:MAG: sulfur carrier protein ThiS [Bacteroidales bacterium]|jgi:sulfur carrier protein|nr:sulfur carrier protein ThiS [Bacteroidales bacterium]